MVKRQMKNKRNLNPQIKLASVKQTYLTDLGYRLLHINSSNKVISKDPALFAPTDAQLKLQVCSRLEH